MRWRMNDQFHNPLREAFRNQKQERLLAPIDCRYLQHGETPQQDSWYAGMNLAQPFKPCFHPGKQELSGVGRNFAAASVFMLRMLILLATFSMVELASWRVPTQCSRQS